VTADDEAEPEKSVLTLVRQTRVPVYSVYTTYNVIFILLLLIVCRVYTTVLSGMF